MTQTTAVADLNAPSVRVDRPLSLESRLQAALEHARRLTAMYELGAIEVAIAWDTVEELWTAQRRQRETAQTSFDRYCMAYPDAPECRIYED